LSTVKLLAETNNPEYNILKAIEEMSELSVRLSQSLTKGASKEDIIEELGDTVFRIKVLTHMYGKDEVNKRVEYKLSTCEEWLKEGKYLNGV